ncbi:MAG: Type 1 glutamine amidotransferase-like domain-containing protein [Candidatus Woesearchaeota archaeon]|nr:MAG: Type 1 glutamine amidotransferase-like domain-containing protein [Candidatus Woesearchaeota archaeon]
MTKLLLTSTGLANQNITNQFLQIIDKPISQIKIIFVPTASRSEEELKYVDESKKELLDLGVLENNIKTLNLDKPISFQEVENFDVIYVCGGNTFYLLKKVRETGFDKVIIEFAKTDKLYFGVSAGSILVCPNIDIASPFDENDVNLTDLTGLNLTDVIVSPHYCEEEKPIIDNFKKKSQYEVVPLTDNQALLVLDGETKRVE